MLAPKHHRAIIELAKAFYEFLPGTGHSSWKGHITFSSVAAECGVENYWQAGSKTQAITNLLALTYEYARGKFEKLIISIVNNAILYREKKKHPVTKEEVEAINILIFERKFPMLWIRISLIAYLLKQKHKPSQHSRQNKKHISMICLKSTFMDFLEKRTSNKLG